MSRLSPSEKKGLLVLSGVMLAGFIVQALLPFYQRTDLYDYSVQDSIFKSINTDSLENEINFKEETNSKYAISSANQKSLPAKSININSSNLNTLQKLPGIGPVTAKNIVEYREANGGFKTLEEIMKVKRIGRKTFDRIKPFIIIE